jgi:hypothetical protein
VSIYANTVNSIAGAAIINVPINVGTAAAQGNAQQPLPGSGLHTIHSVQEVPASAENTVTLRITTDADSRYVWVSIDGGYRLATLAQSGAQNIWEVSYRPNVFAPHTVQVNAFSAYVADPARAVQSFPVNLTAPFVRPTNPSITQQIRAVPSTIDYNERSTITVRTNADVEFVWANIDGERVNARRGNSTATQRTWTIETPRTSRTENINVYANTTDTTAGAATGTIRVNVRDRWSTNWDGNVTIRSAWASPTSLSPWQTLTVEATTNREAENVWIILPNGQRRDLSVTSTVSNERTWRLTITPGDHEMRSGGHNIRMYANSGTGTSNADSRNFWVEITN